MQRPNCLGHRSTGTTQIRAFSSFPQCQLPCTTAISFLTSLRSKLPLKLCDKNRENLFLSKRKIVTNVSCQKTAQRGLKRDYKPTYDSLRMSSQILWRFMFLFYKNIIIIKDKFPQKKCLVSADKHEDRKKQNISIFHLRRLKGRKGKAKTDLGRLYKESQARGTKENFFQRKLSTQSNFRQLSIFVIRAATQLGLAVLGFRTRNLADSSRSSGSYLVVTLKRGFEIRSILLSFRFLIFLVFISCSDCLVCGLADIQHFWEIRIFLNFFI